jgi:DNA-binding IclR family transcriptional regulator
VNEELVKMFDQPDYVAVLDVIDRYQAARHTCNQTVLREHARISPSHLIAVLRTLESAGVIRRVGRGNFYSWRRIAASAGAK